MRRARAAALTEQTRRLERDLHAFVRAAWPIVEPGKALRDGWHLAAICEHLQAVTAGEIPRLLINIPPRMTKSLATTVFWPAWEWALDPSLKYLFTSYNHALSIRDNVRARRLLQSPWYRERWPHVELHDDQNQKIRYETTAGGYRIAVSFGGSATGDGGERRVVDDPHAAGDVHSDVKREGDLQWWRETWSTRTIDPATDRDVVIMQRLHERDLSGFLLEEIGGYEHLVLPMRFEAERRCTTILGWTDPRTKEGELLDPERFPPDVVDRLEVALGPYGAAGQLQQRPAPAGGGIVKAAWFGYWVDEDHRHLLRSPPKVKDEHGDFIEPRVVVKPPTRDADQVLQSWDMAFKGTSGSSRVAGQVWEQHGADAYLIANRAERLTFTETITAVEQLSADYPEAYRKLVEDKANGPAVIDSLKSKLGGFEPVEPYGTKEARMHAVTPMIAAGNALLPHPEMPGYHWATALRERLATFPAGTTNDEADATSQALQVLQRPVPTLDHETPIRRSSRAGTVRRR